MNVDHFVAIHRLFHAGLYNRAATMMHSDQPPLTVKNRRTRRARQSVSEILNPCIIYISNDVMVEGDLFCLSTRMLDDVCSIVYVDVNWLKVESIPISICVTFDTNHCPIIFRRRLKASIRIKIEVDRLIVDASSILLVIELDDGGFSRTFSIKYVMVCDEQVVAD